MQQYALQMCGQQCGGGGVAAVSAGWRGAGPSEAGGAAGEDTSLQYCSILCNVLQYIHFVLHYLLGLENSSIDTKNASILPRNLII